MRRSFARLGWLSGLAALLLASAGLVRPAVAVGLFNGSVITVDGLQFTVGNCDYAINGGTLPGGTNNSCGTTNANAVAEIVSQSGPGSQVLVDKNGGGTLFSTTTGSGNDELKFTLTIVQGTGSTARTSVSNMNTTLSGSESGSTNQTRVADTITHTGLSGFSGTTALNLGTLSAFDTFTKLTNPFSFTVTEDLKLTTTNGATLKLNNVLLAFSPAPEPVSVGIFMVGLAALGAARRGRGKSRKAA